jgi:VWFA-related protein
VENEELGNTQAGVRISVSVVDRTQHFTNDLAQEDFSIVENKTELPVGYFSRVPFRPYTLGVLVDCSKSHRALPFSLEAASSHLFQELIRDPDAAFVAAFNIRVLPLGDFTTDPSQFSLEIRHVLGMQPSGGTAFYDAVSWACKTKMEARTGTKALVVITDALDNQSERTKEEAAVAARKAGTAVYVLCLPSRGSAYGAEGRGWQVAKILSTSTGGRAFAISRDKDFLEAFEEIGQELLHPYYLSSPALEHQPCKRIQKIKIRIAREGLKVASLRILCEEEEKP